MPAAEARAVAFSRVFRQPTYYCEQIFGVGERGPGHSLARPPRSMRTRRAAPRRETIPLVRLDPTHDPLRSSPESFCAVRRPAESGACGRARTWSAGEAAALIGERRSRFLRSE